MKKICPTSDKMYIEVTSICNFKCDFCPSYNTKRKKQHMDFSLFKKIVDEIAKEKITKSIGFHIMGEPLLYPKIIDAVKYVKSKGLETIITTNGSLLKEKMVKNLIKAKLNLLTISMETVGKKEHETRRTAISYKDYHDTIINAVKIIKNSSSSMKVELCMLNTFTKGYFDVERNINISGKSSDFKKKLSSFIQELYEATGRKVPIKKIKSGLNRINLNDRVVISLDDQIAVYIQLFGDWGNAFTKRKIYPAKFAACDCALDTVGILNDGTVNICCVDYDGGTAIGNVQKESLYNILTSKKAQAIRDGFKRFKVVHPYCRRCLGSPNKLKAIFKGLASIYAFKILKIKPTRPKEARLFAD